jgi:flagellar hook-associated protein 2
MAVAPTTSTPSVSSTGVLSSPGIGSGLDINGLVTKLMAVESQPLTALNTKEATYQAQITAYGSLKGALSSFQTSVAALVDPAKFSAITANLGDATVASSSASAAAAPGSYSVEVQKLAQAHKLMSTTFASPTTVVGSGTLTLSFGTYNADTFTLNPAKASQDITIPAGQNSLAGIRDAINAANAGVTAGIVNDGTGYRLTISSVDSGAANALRISVADADSTNTDTSGLSQLAYDGRTVSGIQHMTQTVAAQNATLVIDGITISKASNHITDAIEGVTLNLLKNNLGNPTTLTVSRDTNSVQSAVQSFVKAYNDLNSTITNLSQFNASTNTASTLTGDAIVRSIQAQVRRALTTALPAGGNNFTLLSQVGITFQKDGTLKLDTAKLTTVLSDPSQDVSSLFAVVGKPSDSLISFSGSTAATKDGTYALNISQLATQGQSRGGSAAALTITTGSNDTLSFVLDGVSATIKIAAGTYTPTDLAAEIQSKINGVAALTAAGSSVSVTQSSGVLTVTSNRFGSASTVAITGGTGKSDLFGTPAATAGLDVAGTIDGIGATGSGQTLTGNGNANGLAVTVTGSATGFRGTVRYAHGYADTLNTLVENMLGTDSLLDGRVAGINASIKDIGNQRDALNRRLADIQTRYQKQFNALDTLIASMNSTSTFLTQQLATLPTLTLK